MLIRGIQRTRPTRPDSRLPITVDILTKCIHTLRTGYQTPSTARTLDTMFILGFWVLRCSELAISSKFDPATNPTISDLTILDSETISFLSKQSKTDQGQESQERSLRLHFLIFLRLSNLTKPFASISASEFSKLDPPRTLIFRPCRESSQSHLVPKTSKSCPAISRHLSKKFFQPLFSHRGSNISGPKGLTKHQILTLGRWSSEAFQSYIRTDQSHIKSAHQTLVS